VAPALSAWYVLRATRVHPPGRAGADAARASTYRAALHQAEELTAAAGAVGPASRPLPLYYAISQAGRAIVAACGEVAEAPPLHGLKAPVVAERIFETVVKPDPPGQFQTVAEAAGSEGLSVDVQLGRLMATIPELVGWPQLHDEWPAALRVWPQEPHNRFDEIAAEAIVPAAIVFPWQPANRHTIESILAAYPMRVRPISQSEGASLVPTIDGTGVLLHWPRKQGDEDPLPPAYGPEGRRWIRPAVCDAQDPPSLLMTWWAILYALSMVARYHPVEWVSALNLDASTAAVVLGRALDVALDVLPELVWDTLAARAS